MPTVEQSVEIALPPKDVWEYIAVAENWPNWENSMVECKQITDGPDGRGKPLARCLANPGQASRVDIRIHRVRPTEIVEIDVRRKSGQLLADHDLRRSR